MSGRKQTPGQGSSSASASTTRLTPEQRQWAWYHFCLKMLTILDYATSKHKIEAKLGYNTYKAFPFNT